MYHNESLFDFNEESMKLVFAALIETQPKFIGGSSNSIIIAEFQNFRGECREHETHFPFVEMFDQKSKYEHKINNELHSNSGESRISYYSNQLGYYVNCSKPTKCTLLGLNPTFFKNILTRYGLEKHDQYLKDIDGVNEVKIKSLVNSIRNHIYFKHEDWRHHDEEYLKDLSGALLAHLFVHCFKYKIKHFERPSQDTIEAALEWIDNKIEMNEETSFEKLLKYLDIKSEDSYDFSLSFKKNTGKYYWVYCMDRRTEFLIKISLSTSRSSAEPRLSEENLKKALSFFREKIEFLKEEKYSNSESSTNKIVEEAAKELRYTSDHFSKAFIGSVGISPREYYLQQVIELVKHLLVTKDDPDITSIARQVGYNASTPDNSLRPIFKKFVGITPRDFKKEYGKRKI